MGDASSNKSIHDFENHSFHSDDQLQNIVPHFTDTCTHNAAYHLRQSNYAIFQQDMKLCYFNNLFNRKT